MSTRTCILLLALLALIGPTARAAGDRDEDRPWSVEVAVGAEYDSNVAVLELDSSSGEGDTAAVMELGLDFDKDVDRFGFKLGYDFSQTSHDEFDAFDLRIHRGSTELSWDFGRTDAGVTFDHADAALDGDGFLVLQRSSPYLSHLFGETLFLRLAYVHTDKEFETTPARDATAIGWSAGLFYFLNGVRDYLIFDLSTHDEDARDDAFDYDGIKVKAAWNRRIGWFSRDGKVRASLRYETREYDGPPLPLPLPPGDRREDDRYGVKLEWQLPLGERWFLEPAFEYNVNSSNLTSVDFDKQVGSLSIRAKF